MKPSRIPPMCVTAIFFATGILSPALMPAAIAQVDLNAPSGGGDITLVPGNPALRESMAARYANYVSWLLEVSLTAEQRARLRTMMIDDWKGAKAADIKSDLDALNLEEQVGKRSPGERAYLLRKLQPEAVKGLKTDVDNPYSRMLLSLYEETHKPIAPGNPPLTRQSSDAFAELCSFVINEATGKKIALDGAMKDAWAEAFVQKYAGFSAEQQKTFGQMPDLWATVQLAWAKSSEADREKLRAQWRKSLPGGQGEDPQKAQALKASAAVDALAKKDFHAVSPGELLQGAKNADLVAAECRREGGEKNLEIAKQWDQAALNLRNAAQARNAPATGGARKTGSPEAYAAAMRRLQSQHNTFIMMMNMNMMSYVSAMNVFSNIGGSGYHYELH